MEYSNIHGLIYSEILRGIMSETEESIPQCYYIVGHRGYGKTWLLHNIEKKLSGHGKFHSIYVDCLLTPSFSIEETITKYHNIGSRLVLFLDDMDILLSNMERDVQFRVRSLLHRKGAPIIVGSGSGLSPDFTDYQAPFYDAFIFYHLHELTSDKFIELFDKMRSKSRYCDITVPAEIVLKLLNEIGRTPESCRLLSRVSSFANGNKKILLEALSPLSLYYRNKIMSLSVAQRKTLMYMLSKDKPVLLKEIREATGQTAGDISPQLRALAIKGLISANRQGAKKTEYLVTDKLMSSWYRNCALLEDMN